MTTVGTCDATVALRMATTKDVPAILDLLRVSLGVGSIPRNERYWRWKHQENPFGPSPVLIGEADESIVALRTFMRWEWCGRRMFRAVRAVDTATHPDWQGRGLFSLLTRKMVDAMREEGVHFVFNTPNDKSRSGYLKMGWQAVGRTDIWIRPLRPLAIIRSLRRARSGAGTPGRRVPSLPLPPASAVLDQLRADLTREPAARGNRLVTNRTPEYLWWRYADIPEFEYHAFGESGSAGAAGIVFRVVARGALREIRICEILMGAGRSSRKRAADLIRRIANEVEGDFISVMPTRGTGDPTLLLRCGFLPAWRTGPILTVRPLQPDRDMPDLLDRRSWNASIGDLELF